MDVKNEDDAPANSAADLDVECGVDQPNGDGISNNQIENPSASGAKESENRDDADDEYVCEYCKKQQELTDALEKCFAHLIEACTFENRKTLPGKLK